MAFETNAAALAANPSQPLLRSEKPSHSSTPPPQQTLYGTMQKAVAPLTEWLRKREQRIPDGYKTLPQDAEGLIGSKKPLHIVIDESRQCYHFGDSADPADSPASTLAKIVKIMEGRFGYDTTKADGYQGKTKAELHNLLKAEVNAMPALDPASTRRITTLFEQGNPVSPALYAAVQDLCAKGIIPKKYRVYERGALFYERGALSVEQTLMKFKTCMGDRTAYRSRDTDDWYWHQQLYIGRCWDELQNLCKILVYDNIYAPEYKEFRNYIITNGLVENIIPDFHYICSDGNRPLILAAGFGDVDMVKALLPTSSFSREWISAVPDALDQAVINNRLEVVAVINNRLEVVKALRGC